MSQRAFAFVAVHSGIVLLLCTTAWPGLFEMLAFFSFGFFLGLGPLLLYLALRLGWEVPKNEPRRRRDYVRGGVSTALVGLWIVAFLLDLPLRIGFELNRAAFEEFNQEVQQMPPTLADDPVAYRRWVGMYHITALHVGHDGSWLADTDFGYGMCLDWHFYGFEYSVEQRRYDSHITGNWYAYRRKW